MDASEAHRIAREVLVEGEPIEVVGKGSLAWEIAPLDADGRAALKVTLSDARGIRSILETVPVELVSGQVDADRYRAFARAVRNASGEVALRHWDYAFDPAEDLFNPQLLRAAPLQTDEAFRAAIVDEGARVTALAPIAISDFATKHGLPEPSVDDGVRLYPLVNLFGMSDPARSLEAAERIVADGRLDLASFVVALLEAWADAEQPDGPFVFFADGPAVTARVSSALYPLVFDSPDASLRARVEALAERGYF